MSFQNKNTIAYLTSLSLLFSYAEMFLPRLGFFKLGLANTVILSSLNLNFSNFALLCFFKSLAGCLISGTLFSPFFLISLGQSILSGFFMYLLNFLCKKRKLISIYGISISGAACSAVFQILFSSLYLGQGTTLFLGPLLAFSIFSGIFTAFICVKLNLENLAENKSFDDLESCVEENFSRKKRLKSFFMILGILLFSVAIFCVKNIYVLAGFFLIVLILQIISGRKILILPHIFLWLFVILSCIFIPEGKILFKIGKFSITQGALFTGIRKSLQLSASFSLSQCTTKIRFSSNSIIALTFKNFSKMTKNFNETKGNFFTKIKSLVK